MMRDVWRVLRDLGADVVISGHDHIYERFGRQDETGRATSSGLRSFVVGTGGAELTRPVRASANSETRAIVERSAEADAESRDLQLAVPAGPPLDVHRQRIGFVSVAGRRHFLSTLGGAALGASCRGRADRGDLILRLSHSMTAGPTALHVFADKFRQFVESMSGGAIKVRLFPSGTLGQEREVVQQLQEGLVDFMVSGTAIWGSVAPRLQVFDFPFLWRDWDHVHRVVDSTLGRVGRRVPRGQRPHAAARLGRLVRFPARHHPQPRHRRTAASWRD